MRDSFFDHLCAHSTHCVRNGTPRLRSGRRIDGPCGHIRFEENKVISILLENKAGKLTGVAAKLSEAGVNLEAIYLVGVAEDLIKLAIAADDIKKAK